MALAPSRYELLERIAVGGMAEVFRAKAFGAHGFEKTLAIKKILPELAKDPEFEDRFIAEAKLAVELSHANVVQVLDFGRFAGTLFIAMELVNGLDLAALLKFYSDKGGRVPIPAAFQMSIEIVRGLSFAHQNGVVHRDVSPSNILLSKAGEVKIADFGIAMAMREELAADEGRIMGKWRYMSPEQTHGAKLGETSDLFSAAVVVYEIFAGARLFPGIESAEIIENIHCMEIPKLSELRPGVPEAVDEVLAAALQRDPSQRTGNGADMLRALTEASYKSSIVATSIGVADAVAEADEAGVAGTSVKPPNGIDAAIRDQLLKAKESNEFRPTERRTAVAAPEDADGLQEVAEAFAHTELGPMADDGGTMVRSGVDDRGVTMWKLDRETVAAIPSAKRTVEADKAAERAEQFRALVPESGNERYEQDPGGHAGLRRGVILSAVVFISFMALMLSFVVGGGTAGKRAAAQMTDAAAATPLPVDVVEELLIVDSLPRGASVYVGGRKLASVTPAEAKVPVNVDIEVRILLDGYEEYRETKTLKEGRVLDFRPTLVPFRSTLILTTTPKGALAILDGKEMGTTPLSLANLRPGKGRLLELSLKNYEDFEEAIDLTKDETTTFHKTLKSTIVYNTIIVSPLGNWFEVRFGGKYLGDAPGKFRLPVGKHRLKLRSPTTGKSKMVTVDVADPKLSPKPKVFRFDL
ncbi:MAG: protein kinase [Myxococcales bacterium]|nr:protein kinase [Myxococcales bacterium]